VFRVPASVSRDAVIERLQQDARVESVQPLNEFETSLSPAAAYDDTYASLQYGLEQLDITSAHNYTRGDGIHIAVIDSNADLEHEDLRGRVAGLHDFVVRGKSTDRNHGTAVVSVIGATANNARGIVGVAPEAAIDLYVACWLDDASQKSVCDSFSLAKALDTVVEDAPRVLNMSLRGPPDGLLGRLLDRISAQGTVIVAAAGTGDTGFPASHPAVIGVRASPAAEEAPPLPTERELYAPGRQIMVALPRGGYDFRSGNSIAAAQVSGVIALVLAVEPRLDAAAVQSVLLRSQRRQATAPVSIDACRAMQLMDKAKVCSDFEGARLVSELKPET